MKYEVLEKKNGIVSVIGAEETYDEAWDYAIHYSNDRYGNVDVGTVSIRAYENERLVRVWVWNNPHL